MNLNFSIFNLCSIIIVEKYLVSIDGYQDGGRILINLSIPSNCSQVFASVALFLVMPYQPWYMYSYIYKHENPWYWLIPGAIQEFIGKKNVTPILSKCPTGAN
jgi:hypothetical protein